MDNGWTQDAGKVETKGGRWTTEVRAPVARRNLLNLNQLCRKRVEEVGLAGPARGGRDGQILGRQISGQNRRRHVFGVPKGIRILFS